MNSDLPREASDDEPPTDSQAHELERVFSHRVAAWARAVRPDFANRRRDFSFAVCDALAAEGIRPNAATVHRVGRWGHTRQVGEDVAAWYQALASRLAAHEAAVPLPARKQANELVERLYALAITHAKQTLLDPLSRQVEAAAADVIATKALLQEADLRTTALTGELAGLQAELAQSRTLTQLQADQHADELTRHQEAIAAADAAKAVVQAALDKATSGLTASQAEATAAQIQIAQERAKSVQAIAQQEQRSREEVKALMIKMDQERTAAAAERQSLQGEASVLRAKADALKDDITRREVASIRHEGQVAALTRQVQDLEKDVASARSELLAEQRDREAERLRLALRESDMQPAMAALIAGVLMISPEMAKAGPAIIQQAAMIQKWTPEFYELVKVALADGGA